MMAEMFVDPHLFMYDPAKYILVSKEEVQRIKEEMDAVDEPSCFLSYAGEGSVHPCSVNCQLYEPCKKLTEFGGGG